MVSTGDFGSPDVSSNLTSAVNKYNLGGRYLFIAIGKTNIKIWEIIILDILLKIKLNTILTKNVLML